MNLSEFTLINLTKAVCGDASYTPYMRGHEIVHFFNKHGYNEVYGAGFPSRWKYTEDKLRELNGSDSIRKIIEETVDPRRFHNLPIKVEDAVTELNELLKFDKLELRKSGDFYKLHNTTGQLIQAELRPPNIKLGYALPMIASTSCPNCTKPHVVCRP